MLCRFKHGSHEIHPVTFLVLPKSNKRERKPTQIPNPLVRKTKIKCFLSNFIPANLQSR